MSSQGSHQRSFHIRKTLGELTQRARSSRRHRLSLPLSTLPSHLNAKDDYVYDILYECQRGSWTVGYSSKTLLQFDPNPWCDTNMNFTPMKPSTYQLPDPTWEWVNKDWMVDMTDDVDEAGWQYAVRFHGAVWHGNYKHFRSFVRRRRWIRLRHRITQGAADPVELPTSSKTTSAPAVGQLVDVGEPSHACSTSSDWPTQFAQCRLDRERIHTLTSLPPPEKLALLSNGAELMKYLHQLDFEDAKRLVLKDFLLAKYQPSLDQPIPLSSLSTQEKIFIDSLCFYSDMCSLLLIDA